MTNPDIIALQKKTLAAVLDTNGGREKLHASHPDEIEYYACAFELVDSQDKTEKFLAFPVMPSSMEYGKITATNIDKTQGGLVITNQPTFIPRDINFSGNFGQRFRRIFDIPLNGQKIEKENPKNVQLDNVNTAPTRVLSGKYKTGYGHIKMLERLLEQSQKEDFYFQPYKLFFYNLSFNTADLVELVNMKFNQSRDSGNMTWNYSITLKAVAPAGSVFSNVQRSLSDLLKFSSQNRDINRAATKVEDIIKQKLKSEIKTELGFLMDRQVRKLGMQDKARIGSAFNILETLTREPDILQTAVRDASNNFDIILGRVL